MTGRLTLLSKIYVPRSMGADDLLNSNDSGSNDTDPEITIGVRYVADKYFPILAEETVANLMPVSAGIMREVVADKLICPWRLERDGFSSNFGWHRKRVTVSNTMVRVADVQMKGCHTYTDLITLVRLAEG